MSIFIETERWEVTRTEKRKNREEMLNGYIVSVWGDEVTLVINSGDRSTIV